MSFPDSLLLLSHAHFRFLLIFSFNRKHFFMSLNNILSCGWTTVCAGASDVQRL